MTDARLRHGWASKVSGFSWILIATIVAGVASYAVTLWVPREIGLTSYALFAVFWSVLYFIVGTLSGVQQEIARATRPVEGSAAPSGGARAGVFALVAAVAVGVVVLASAPLWIERAFPFRPWEMVAPLVVGVVGYVFVAVLAGSLYGVSRWVPLAVMIAVDAVLRLIAIFVALSLTTDVVVAAWAAALPFPATLVILWPLLRKFVAGKTHIDVGYGRLGWNVVRVLGAAASTGVMVSGFPFLLGLTSPAEPKVLVGLYVLTITLTRAPLIVVTMSLQSYLMVTFRDRSDTLWRTFFGLQGILLVGGILLALLGWLSGPAVFDFFFPSASVRPQGWFIAVLVISSALVAALCVTAAAVLSRAQHVVYGAGWFAAAAATVIILFLPIGFELRTVLSLIVGPIVGLAVHGSCLAVSRRQDRQPEFEPS